MVYKQTPKGYLRAEFPLPHTIVYHVSFNIDSGPQTTYFPIILNDEALINADLVNVNPEHGSFADADHAYCHKNSIIPRISVNLRAKMTKGGVETDKLRSLIFNWMPIYTSFLNRLEAEDSKTAIQVEDILELEHETVGKSCYPLWDATKLGPPSGVVELHATPTTALMGLTTTAVQENIAWDKNLFFDALQYYTNAPMLRKVVGKMHRVQVTRDRSYKYSSNNFTNPMVKRINPYTFCGILMHVPSADSPEQLQIAADVTDIPHIQASCRIRYDEWNAEFDQTSS